MIALAAKFNNHDLQASSAAPGKTWFHSFTKGLSESVIEGTFVFFLKVIFKEFKNGACVKFIKMKK